MRIIAQRHDRVLLAAVFSARLSVANRALVEVPREQNAAGGRLTMAHLGPPRFVVAIAIVKQQWHVRPFVFRARISVCDMHKVCPHQARFFF